MAQMQSPMYLYIGLAHYRHSINVYGINKYMYSLKGQQIYSDAYILNLTRRANFSTDFHSYQRSNSIKVELSRPIILAQLHFCTLGPYFPPYSPSFPFYSFVWVWVCGCEGPNCLALLQNRGVSQWPLLLTCSHSTLLICSPMFWSLWYQQHFPKNPWMRKVAQKVKSDPSLGRSALMNTTSNIRHHRHPLNRNSGSWQGFTFLSPPPTYSGWFLLTWHLVSELQMCHINSIFSPFIPPSSFLLFPMY